MGPRLIIGGVTLASWPRGAQSPADEKDHRELRIDEDGDLSFYHACVGWDSEPVNGVTWNVLSAPTIVGSVREFIAVAVAISHTDPCPRVLAYRDRTDRIRSYRHQVSGWPDHGPPCTDDESG